MPATSEEGTAVNLSAAATDPAGIRDPLTYTWTVTGPNSFSTTLDGMAVSFTPTDDGAYTVELAVWDGDGGSATRSATITVDNVAPALTAPADQAANEGTAKSFSLGSFTDPGADADW